MAGMIFEQQENREWFGRLRKLMIGGEAFPAALAKQLKETVPGTIHNMYGPTETTVWSATHTVIETDGPVSLVVSLLTGKAESPSASRAPQASEPQAPAPQTPQPSQAPQPKPTVPSRPRPTPARPPLAAGTKAPTVTLKDRLGVIHRLEIGRGHKTVVLFVWTLNDETRQLIRDLDGRVRKSGGRVAALVILMRPDRVAMRTLSTTW